MREPDLDTRKTQARSWFEELQTRIIAAFETIEAEATGPFAPEAREPGRFEMKPWSRTDHTGEPGGGGRMAMLPEVETG